MNRLEKIAKKQLDENNDAITALKDKYVSSLNTFRSMEEKNISEANLNIQKILTNIIDKDSDEIVSEMYQNLTAIDESNSNLDILDKIEAYLFEEIQERTEVTGLQKKK